MRRSVTMAALIGVALMTMPLSVAAEDAPSNGRNNLLVGIYSDQWEAARDLSGLSAVSPTPLSLAGTFHTLRESEDGWSPLITDRLLEQVWSAHTTPVANVNVGTSAYRVARGDVDGDIASWAGRVRAWLDRGEGRSLLVAPMQEMNGDWVPYGMDPGNYRIAFRRFVETARASGLDHRVRWVFAPNGWSVPPYRMADYYPGDDVVDFVGVSSYNFGSLVGFWTPVTWAVDAALDEARTFAPDKPFILTQVGSSTAGGDRDAWLREMFRVAARDPNVVGLVYFNFIKETDWKVWDGATVAAGWTDGMRSRSVRHVWPLDGWFQPGPVPFATFEGTFADDDLLPMHDDIEWLAGRGAVAGCGQRAYCPDRVMTRAQLASVLARALALDTSSVDVFADDDGFADESAIDAVAAAGIMPGCDTRLFCPHAPATADVVRQALTASLDSDAASPDSSPTPARGKVSAICPNARVCQKVALTRGEVAAIVRALLEGPQAGTVAAPEETSPATAGPTPWWVPSITDR